MDEGGKMYLNVTGGEDEGKANSASAPPLSTWNFHHAITPDFFIVPPFFFLHSIRALTKRLFQACFKSALYN